MEEHNLPKGNVDPYTIIAQLGEKLCHFVALVGDLETKLSGANSRIVCLEHELEEEQRRRAQTNIYITKIVSIGTHFNHFITEVASNTKCGQYQDPVTELSKPCF